MKILDKYLPYLKFIFERMLRSLLTILPAFRSTELTAIGAGSRNAFFTQKVLIPLFISSACLSCKKESPEKIEVKSNVGLSVHAHHHSWDVQYIKVWIKKNATEFPGNDTTVYSASATTDSYGKADFGNLSPANYYIYATGFDAIWGDTVYGNIPVSLLGPELANTTVNVELLVSE
jgi:hypothetical protein